jgi:hypothetical protein
MKAAGRLRLLHGKGRRSLMEDGFYQAAKRPLPCHTYSEKPLETPPLDLAID